MNHKKGEILMIYEDPLTQTKEEGWAKLLRKIMEHDRSEYWRVEFLDDDSVAYRWVTVGE